MSGIKLSAKHGVNPSMSRCIICGGAGNEIILFGRLPGDAEAPRLGPVTSLEPCEKCRKQYLDEGVLLVEMDGTPRDENPTGRIAVLKNEAFNRIFNVPLPPKKIAMIPVEVSDRLGLFHHADNGTLDE
ncbi:MAG: hypothetical protein WC374_13280 [Phycisphaerae bacterium]|jgi:hypothetical protein